MTTAGETLKFGFVPVEQQAAALSLLLADLPQSEIAAQVTSTLAAAQRGEIGLDTLISARRGHSVVGIVWGQMMPGKTALLWPPRLMLGETPAVADELLRRIDTHLASRHIRVVQAVLATDAHVDAEFLKRHAYGNSVELLYLVNLLDRRLVPSADSQIEFESFRLEHRERMLSLIEATYIGTLDAPALDGARDMSDVLDGYRGTGAYSPERWFFVTNQGQDIGCLLLTDHPRQNQWELIYMGLIPAARGCGWGVQVTRQAQALARDAGCERLILAVDVANDPAIAVYTKAGFVEWFRRSVLLKILDR